MSRRRIHRAAAIVAAVVLATTACAARFDRPDTVAGGVVDPGTGEVIDPGTGLPVDNGTTGGPTSPATGGATPGTTGTGGTTGVSTTGTAGTTGTTTSGTTGTTTGSSSVDPGRRTGVTATSIRICYLIPLSGAAPLPPQVEQGVRAYWRYLDGKGGIHGRKVEQSIRIYDTTSTEATARSRAQQAIDDGCFLVAHLDRLGVQKAIGEYLDARNFPNVAVQTPVNLAANQEWTFGITIDHGVQGRLIANYMKNRLGKTKVAVVRESDPTLKDGVATFAAQAKAVGLQVVYSTTIDPDGNDFSGQARDLRTSGAEVVWLYMAPVVMRKFVRQAEVNYHPIWFGNSISWNFDVAFTGDTTGDLRGARAFSPWPALDDARTRTYQQAYQQAYADPPLDLGIPGWGLGQIVSSALLNAGKDLGQNGFRHAMQNLKLATVGLVDKTPLLWAPIAFSPGVRTGSSQVATFRESGGNRWVMDANFRSSY